MTAKMTDEQIVNETVGELFNTSNAPRDMYVRQSVIYSYRLAEKKYLPQIQQLHGEIERLKEQNVELDRHNQNVFELSKSIKSKHEKLVKASKELIDEVNMNFKDDEGGGYYEEDMRGYPLPTSTIDKLIKLCTESEDKTGPSIPPQSLADRWG